MSQQQRTDTNGIGNAQYIYSVYRRIYRHYLFFTAIVRETSFANELLQRASEHCSINVFMQKYLYGFLLESKMETKYFIWIPIKFI